MLEVWATLEAPEVDALTTPQLLRAFSLRAILADSVPGLTGAERPLLSAIAERLAAAPALAEQLAETQRRLAAG